MSIKSYFSPEVVKTFDSKFNTKVQLVTFSGHLRLDMGGLTQSGLVIEKIWAKAFNKLLGKKSNPQEILILGLAAGSVAKVISKKWPKAKMTGIEIDPLIIKIAKKYFACDKIPNLTIINQDAVKFVKQNKQHFDLILVDCYRGYEIPPSFENSHFLARLLRSSSHLLINRLFWADYQQKTLVFLSRLRKSFIVNTCRTPSNLVLSIQV